MQRRVLVLVLVLAAACDGDPAPVDAADPDAAIDAAPAIDAATDGASADAGPQVCGATAIAGTFEGIAYQPIQRASVARSADGVDVMLLRESAGAACDQGPAIERFLTLAFACPPIAAGTYPVLASFDGSPCPPAGRGVLALVQSNGGFLLGSATGGEVVITSAGACVAGTFTASFDTGDVLTGQFGAIHCP